MAVLSDADRATLAAQWMRDNKEAISILKADVRAAVNAADDWANTNAANYNNALPTAAKNNLSAQQKARLLEVVVKRRFEVS